ncbi:MAG: hypothetical protein J7M30_14120, partial [Deltaproteobacteria bacterium]|nr:hypothetical protein [Deltaproteobacteria bacterium]
MTELWSPTGKPVAPLSFADSLRERRDLVVRHPDRNPIYPRLKPWLSAGGVKRTAACLCVARRQVIRATARLCASLKRDPHASKDAGLYSIG